MAKLLRVLFAVFWLTAVGVLGSLVYIAVTTETDPRALWGWLVMCALTFVSVTFLAYNMLFGHHSRADAPHHHKHLNQE